MKKKLTILIAVCLAALLITVGIVAHLHNIKAGDLIAPIKNDEKIEKLFTQIDNPQIPSALYAEIEDETVIKEVVEKLTDCKLSDKGKVSSIPYQEGEFKAILIVHFNSKDARIYLKENGEFYVFENNVYQKYTCNDSTVTNLYHDLFAITMSENAPID